MIYSARSSFIDHKEYIWSQKVFGQSAESYLFYRSVLIINFATCDFWTLVKKWPVLLIDT